MVTLSASPASNPSNNTLCLPLYLFLGLSLLCVPELSHTAPNKHSTVLFTGLRDVVMGVEGLGRTWVLSLSLGQTP